MSKQEMILKIQEIQNNNPDKEVTRKLFRDETSIPDSQWLQHFGTWLEFKSAAGLDNTKIQKRVLSAVSKHSSVEILSNFNQQREGFEGKFLKPADNRFQTILTGSDIHDKLCDPFYRRLFINTAYRVQPEKIILAGDIFDFYEFSKYNKDPRKVNILEAINWVHDFLSDLRNASPNSEIIMLEGNHEARLLKHLAEASPHVMPILSDLLGFTVSSLLGLDKYEVNYIAQADLATFNETDLKKEISKNYYIAHEAVLFHHFPYAKQWGLPGVNGHHHSHKVDHLFSALRGPYEWHQLGAGHIRVASYCNAEKWSNGFSLIHVDTLKKFVQIEYFDCTNEHCVIGGKWYERSDGESKKE
jgi:hypothetical protein